MLSLFAFAEERSGRNPRIERLILRLAEGDPSSLGELYELIKTDIYAFALSKLANAEDAEDITHDTFVGIYKNAPMYQPMGKPLAWIFTMEHNLIRRHVTVRGRTVSLDETVEIPDTGGDLAEKIVKSEFLRTLLSVLDEEERTVIALHINSGLKHREIARVLDKPLSTVLSKYNRAIKKLKSIVKEEKL